MRRTLFVFAALLFVLPTSVHADFVSLAQSAGIKDNGLCKNVNPGDPTGSRTFGQSEIANLKTYMQQKIICASACFEERFAISIPSINPLKLKLAVSAANKCTKTDADPQGTDQKAAKLGCAKGENEPTATVVTPALNFGAKNIASQTIGPKSRCDSRFTNSVTSMVNNISIKNPAGITSDLAKISVLPVSVGGVVNGNAGLFAAFQAARNSQENAQAAIEKDPQAANDYIAGTLTSDQKKVNDAVKILGLDLNTDLSSIDTMAVAKAVATPAPDDESTVQPDPANPHTFNQEADKTLNATPLNQQGANEQIRSIAATMCQQYSIQNCDQFGNNMIATFHQECGGKPNCGGSTYIGSFQLSSGEYAKGINAYLSNCDQSSDACQTIAATCSGDGRGIHMCNTAAAVANHATIEAGVQAATDNPYQQAAMHMMYQLMPTQTVRALTSGDSNAIWSMQLVGSCGSTGSSIWALCKNAVYLNPGATGADAIDGILGRYRALVNGVNVATNGTAGPVPVGSYTGSPFGGFLGGGYQTQFSAPYAGSPFASVTPIGYGYGGYGYGYGYGYGGYTPVGYSPTVSTGGTVSTGLPVSTGGTVSTGPVTQTPVSQQIVQAGSGGTTASVGAGAANLLVQPNPVKRGTAIKIAWSTVGMRSDTPCQLFVGTTFLAQANEGSRSFDTASIASGADLTFVLQCFAASDGSKIQKTATSTVQ